MTGPARAITEARIVEQPDRLSAEAPVPYDAIDRSASDRWRRNFQESQASRRRMVEGFHLPEDEAEVTLS